MDSTTRGDSCPVAPDSLAHEDSRGGAALTQPYGAAIARQVSAADAAEVLSAPDHLAGPAVRALGWDGVALPPTVLLGRRVVVVAEFDVDAHARRIAAGWGPVIDRVSVSTWAWPEMAELAPPPAVRLLGVLAPARHWRTGLTAVTPFAGLCPTAMLLPAHIGRAADCLTYAEHYGPSVVAAAGEYDLDRDAVDVVHAGRSGPVMTVRGTTISRWVHELVYALLLNR